ncbi:MAG TPA: MFS transporter [Thermoanaerobaculia bacterium]|jgi:UMF1 family MFS transporter|nr:MFS transporter [Thermoanaerobaculia bacterium]
MTGPVIEITSSGELLVRARASLLERVSWALYDFANTIFSMNIATLYFPVWIVAERGASATMWSLATSASAAVVLFAAPYFGARSDVSRRRKPWVVGLTLACVAATALIAPLSPAPVLVLLATFVVADVAYQLALPFYNAMMPELVPEAERGRLSGLGTALGYVGSIAGVLAVAPLVSGKWSVGGPPGRPAAFLPTAALFLLFSLPLFLFCHDHVPRPKPDRERVGFRQIAAKIAEAFRDTRKYPGLRRFLFASYLYQDALGTAIAFMAIYAVKVLGLARGEEVRLFVALTVPAVIGSFLAGLASDRLGPRRTLLFVLWGWILGLAAIALAPSLSAFWVGGALLGFVFGGIWSVERPLLLTLVPDAEAGRFFGLLVLSARAAAIAGPLVWALIADHLFAGFGEGVGYRVAVASLALFMVGAILLLHGVPDVQLRSRRVSA